MHDQVFQIPPILHGKWFIEAGVGIHLIQNMLGNGLFGSVWTSRHRSHEEERQGNKDKQCQQALQKTGDEKFEHGLVSLSFAERG